MKIGFHSPMPPARTGVADYSAALARALAPFAEIAVNPARPCEVELYHIGNNGLHRPIYHRLLERPGTAVLHDAVLQHFYLGAGEEAVYVEEFVHNYGEWHRGLAGELWRRRSHSAQEREFFEYPMLRRVAEAARTVIVHNPAAAAMVRRHAPSARVEEIPHLFEAPPQPPSHAIVRLREAMGLGPGAYLFGIFGHLRESKRLLAALKVFSRVRERNPWAWLLIAGEFVSEDLARAARPLLARPGVIRVPYLSEAEFWLHAHAVDACINLRYPTAGETSGIAIRLMGIGKPVLVSAGEEVARFPGDACIRVDTGLAEEEMLEAYLLMLSEDRAVGERVGRAAARHIEERHAPHRVAAQLTKALQTR